MRYEYLPDVATADIAFRASGKDINELFENAALATSDTMVDSSSVKQLITREVDLEDKDIEQLLFSFLSEIIFYKDAENLFFSKYEVKIEGKKLTARMQGEKFNKQIVFRNDVKAITMHMLKIEKKDLYYATVVLDI